jgi:hypothetical protein
MARIFEPTPEQLVGYQEWIAGCPAEVRELIRQFDPWTLYRMKSTGHRVTILSFDELEDGSLKLRVNVSSQYNRVIHERNVFGVDSADLEPCDLPGPDEPVGIINLPNVHNYDSEINL